MSPPGEPLERMRTAYAENLKNCVARNPDITMPREWPDACRMRMDMLKAERTELFWNRSAKTLSPSRI